MKTFLQPKTKGGVTEKDFASAIVSIESELLRGARRYFESFGFQEVVVPHITRATGACENIDTLFHVDFFGDRAYLVQTGQLYLESRIPEIGAVYCVGPSFRAEPVADERHLSEFTLIEFELACNLNELMIHIENTIYSMVNSVLKNKKDELRFLSADIDRLEQLKIPFKKVTYTEAVNILSEQGVQWGHDLKSHHEKSLVEYFGNEPIFITHYPKEIKFFNMRTNEDNSEVVNSTDLVFPFSGEAVGAAEREFEYDVLLERLKSSLMLKQLEARGGGIEDFEWYLNELKTHGSIPHAGCGIGLNRVTQFVTGIPDIRYTTAFPLNRETLI